MVVDRLVLKPGIERRLAESVEIALQLADDIVVINTYDGGDRLFSRRLACTYCGVSMPEMTPRAFSFNSPHGACTECQGLGAVYDFDPARLVPDESLSLEAARSRRGPRAIRKLVQEALAGLSRTFGIDLTLPFRRLPKKTARPAVLRRRRRRRARRAEAAPPAAKARKTRRRRIRSASTSRG